MPAEDLVWNPCWFFHRLARLMHNALAVGSLIAAFTGNTKEGTYVV
jgi:hypothetical protein